VSGSFGQGSVVCPVKSFCVRAAVSFSYHIRPESLRSLHAKKFITFERNTASAGKNAPYRIFGRHSAHRGSRGRRRVKDSFDHIFRNIWPCSVVDKHISVFHVTESIVYGILSRFPSGNKSCDFGKPSAYLPAYRDKVPAANDQDIICY